MAAFYACAGPNTGVSLIHNPRFPALVSQALSTFHRLKQLSPDIFLMMHPADQFAGKLDRLRASVLPNPLYDPAAWHKMLDDSEAEFRQRVATEQAALQRR
ncbi:MAG TPA: hypothetical protein VH165_26640 [Kofleriaceae bacterium]|nr:hypothetical protein [Kofleriaceae bacterium]